VPAGFTVISPLSVSATGGKIWTASMSGSTIELKKSGQIGRASCRERV
jgi:hypothetical protein